jgi:beta-glucanase (GH16 family)
MKDPTFWERPENVGQYRDDRRNVFLDGKSNLVLRAAKDGNTYYSAKIQSPWRGGIGHTWEARIKLNCLTAGCWPAWWLGNDDHGEVDVLEWYGNGNWPSATTVHAKSNGSDWATHKIAVDSGWHTWRVQWDAAGIRFWQDYVDGSQPYFDIPANSLEGWPFNDPGYTLFPVLNLAVAGSGGGDPNPGTYPADMLVDWVRVW